MNAYVHGFDVPVYEETADPERLQAAARCYRDAGCWTWLPEYRWFHREYFVQGPLDPVSRPSAGALFPMNFIRLRRAPGGTAGSRPGLVGRLRRRMARNR